MALDKNIEFPILPFESQKEWAQWLDKNHQKSQGIWIKFYKKASKITTIVYAEALEEALCYGWIDSQTKSLDDKAYLQKFTPRRAKSIWSKINCGKVLKLIEQKKMKPAGLAEIEKAKNDGRWEKAYDSPSNMQMPEDFLKALGQNKKAKAFFESLNKTNTYAIGWRIHTAKKPETRAKRIAAIIAMLEKAEKFHP